MTKKPKQITAQIVITCSNNTYKYTQLQIINEKSITSKRVCKNLFDIMIIFYCFQMFILVFGMRLCSPWNI